MALDMGVQCLSFIKTRQPCGYFQRHRSEYEVAQDGLPEPVPEFHEEGPL